MLGVGATAQFKSSECQANFPFLSVPLPGNFWGLNTDPKRRTDSFCALGHFILHSSFPKEKKYTALSQQRETRRLQDEAMGQQGLLHGGTRDVAMSVSSRAPCCRYVCCMYSQGQCETVLDPQLSASLDQNPPPGWEGRRCFPGAETIFAVLSPHRSAFYFLPQMFLTNGRAVLTSTHWADSGHDWLAL